MGILNVTPDSFSDGGQFLDPEAAIRHAEQMVAEGAELIDIGGESTRPGSHPVPLAEELFRVIPVIHAVAKRVPVPLSIDTSKAEVARCAIEAGASMVNDVTALRGDPDMARVVARARVPVILMHMRGTPARMQQRPRYRNVVSDVKAFLAEAIQRAEAAGIPPDHIWVDPGLGFGKTVRHNLLLLQQLDELTQLGKPVVIGPSRKSFIGQILSAPTADRLAGTLACVAYAMHHAVQIVRVHDVKPTAQFLEMGRAIEHAREKAKGKRQNC